MLPSTWIWWGSACMPCGPFFKNRHAIIPGLARFDLAWHETFALLSCRDVKNLLRGQQPSRPSVKSNTPSYVTPIWAVGETIIKWSENTVAKE
jgi:hypothetical protein